MPKKSKKCLAYGCSQRLLKGSGIQFFGFPLSRPHILQKWLRAICKEDWCPTTRSALCSWHFTSDNYQTKSGGPGLKIRLLKEDAVPSVFKIPQYLRKKVIRKVPIDGQSSVTLEKENSISSSAIQDELHDEKKGNSISSLAIQKELHDEEGENNFPSITIKEELLDEEGENNFPSITIKEELLDESVSVPMVETTVPQEKENSFPCNIVKEEMLDEVTQRPDSEGRGGVSPDIFTAGRACGLYCDPIVRDDDAERHRYSMPSEKRLCTEEKRASDDVAQLSSAVPCSITNCLVSDLVTIHNNGNISSHNDSNISDLKNLNTVDASSIYPREDIVVIDCHSLDDKFDTVNGSYPILNVTREELKSELTKWEFAWEKRGGDPLSFRSSCFTQAYGPKVNVNSKSPSEIFFLFFGYSVLERIVYESNFYATQVLGIKLNTSVEEIKAFLGMLIIMGFHRLPSEALYWSDDPNFRVRRVASVMSLNRFQLLMRCILLNYNSNVCDWNSPKFDQLYRLRPLIDHLLNAYHSAFGPSRLVTIDESLLRFEEASSTKRLTPMTSTARNFKVWVAVCAMSGYMISFVIDPGKSEKDCSLELGYRMVSSLVKRLEKLHFCVFLNDSFTTLPLLKSLLEKGIFACGSIRSNTKHFPENDLISDDELKPTQSDFVRCGDISVTKWKNEEGEVMCVASNMHGRRKATKRNERNCDGAHEMESCPNSVASYSAHKGGVKTFDRYMSPYSIGWKSQRWWLEIFYYLLDSAIVNSYIMYKEERKLRKWRTGNLWSDLEFRSQLATELIGEEQGPFPYENLQGRKPFW